MPADSSPTAPIQTDALIIGAGPAGLFQAFELGLLGIHAHIVDTLRHPGGQCAELYGDKPLYDIPGLPFCTGQELVDRLLQQIKPFAPDFHLAQEVTALVASGDGADGRLAVETSRGTRFDARAVVLAAGVGAFTPRRLKVAGIEAFEGTQVFHRLHPTDDLGGKRVVVVGGDDAALERAFALAGGADGAAAASPVTLLHRRAVLQATPERLARLDALQASGAVRFQVGQITGLNTQGDRLQAVEVTDPEARTAPLSLDALVVMLGLSPRLGPLAEWGLALDRKLVAVDPATFATSLPGLYAVGDVVSYPGKKKLILSAFHEATLAAFAIAERNFPDQRIGLQYTTSSSELHRRLGVATAFS